MATTKEYKEFLLEQLNLLEDITCRAMMGEYLLYYDNILFGGIYENDNFLIKKTSSNEKYHLMEELPYKGSKMMYLVDHLEDEELLRNIIIDTCKDLKPKKGK